MSRFTYEQLYMEFSAAQAQKENWYSQYANIYRFVLPNRTAFNVAYNYDNAARYENLQIYDFTPVSAAYQRANDLHSLLMPKDRIWGKLALNMLKIKEDIDDNMMWSIEQYMDHANRLIFQAINSSNLATECPNALLDLVGGTGFIKVESPSDEEPLRFTAIPAYTGYIGMYQSSKVDLVWVKDQMQAWKAREIYKGDNLPLAITQAADTDIIDLYTGKYDMGDGNYCMYVFHDTAPYTPIVEKVLYFDPIIVVRDRVHPGESEGRGIAMDMIWQIQNLNQLWQDHLADIGLRARPAIFFDQTSPFNPYSTVQSGLAGAMLPMQNGRVPLQPFTLPPSSPEIAQTIEDIRNQIRTAFMIDPLGTIDQPVHSATEVAIRENRSQRSQSTDMSRLINDLPKAVYECAMKILVHRGMIKPAMQKLSAESKLSFEFNSPLQDIQSAQDLQNLAQANQFVQQFYGEGAILTATNPDRVRDFLINKLNLPHDLFRSPEEIQELLTQMGQQQAEAQQAQQQAQGAPLPSPSTAPQALPNFPSQPAGTAA